jgi:hypothetical protein
MRQCTRLGSADWSIALGFKAKRPMHFGHIGKAKKKKKNKHSSQRKQEFGVGER